MSAQPNVSQEVTRLLVSESLDAFFPGQPIATLDWIYKALELFMQGHIAMLPQVVSRDYDVARSLNWKAVCPGSPQGQGHIFALAVHKKRSDRFHGAETHARRCSGSENTEYELFPELLVGSSAPHRLKLIEPRPNLFLSRLVCGTYVLNNYRLPISSHWIVNTEILGLHFWHCQRAWKSSLCASKSAKASHARAIPAGRMQPKDTLARDSPASCYYSSSLTLSNDETAGYAKQRQILKPPS